MEAVDNLSRSTQPIELFYEIDRMAIQIVRHVVYTLRSPDMGSYVVIGVHNKKLLYSYSAKKMLISEAQFARTYNTAGVDTDTQIALRSDSKLLTGLFTSASVRNYCAYGPLPTPENNSFKRTPFASLSASPLRGAA